ncbi:hypothetical protein ASD97_12650 [Streptomyces sp. Root63]|uniref:hypothetical protein n=1 Tax=unclassified Streptomyces TaxID=2593676 RepID=UPI0006F9F463|nr:MULTISPECIES: hypothetical protein [unclassified Streptomyces]KQX30692.1 hypothetical protein ASD29_17820 [Streptomyces sp. Root1295]KRA40625.1 hypothetical protein ASD97_12650 [Streptomyces sp. Root63]
MRHPARAVADLLASGLVLAGATAAGSLLFAIAEGGYATLPDLVREVGLPGAVAVAVAPLIALRLSGPRLGRAVLLGAAAGVVGTAVLELVREVGFRIFESMPGDLPMLMGVLLRDQIMQGPDTASNIAGWTYHVWNGGMFGVTYAVLLGGFPFRRFGGAVAGTLMGTGYGLALGTGFLLSPVPKAVGAGVFGTDFGAKFAITVYLAHAGFGALLGWLVHRYGNRIAPLWSVACKLLPPRGIRKEDN